GCDSLASRWVTPRPAPLGAPGVAQYNRSWAMLAASPIPGRLRQRVTRVTFMKSVKFALRYGPTSSLPLPSIYVEAEDQRRGGRERQRRSRHAAVGLPFFDFFKAFASRCRRAIRRPNPRRCARLREGRFVATR